MHRISKCARPCQLVASLLVFRSFHALTSDLAAEALGGVSGEHAADYGLGSAGDVVGKCEGGVAEGVEEFLAVSCIPGGEAREHLKEDHAQVPPVAGRPVTLPVEDLGAEILGGAAEALGAFDSALDALLGEAKVGEFDVPDLIEEDVLGL